MFLGVIVMCECEKERDAVSDQGGRSVESVQHTLYRANQNPPAGTCVRCNAPCAVKGGFFFWLSRSPVEGAGA